MSLALVESEVPVVKAKPATSFLPRYSFWWDRAFIEAGMGASERLVTISAMRGAKWEENGRCYLEWSNTATAKQAGVDPKSASRAKKHLVAAGLITLVREGSYVTHASDLYDVTVLAQNKRPPQ